MSTKFEQLLDYIVNEEMDKANELFHEIVVEKSREIYENLIAEEDEEEQQDESTDREEEEEQQDESMGREEEEEQQDESMGNDPEATDTSLEDSYELEADDDDEDDMPDQDKGDDVLRDIEVDGMGDEEDAILDIKQAIEDLEAAFDELKAAKGMPDSDMDSSDDMDMGTDMDSKDDMMGLREYRETVAKPSGHVAGANTGEKMPVSNEGQSPISSGSGKPTSGANSKNIVAKGATSNEDGTSPKGKVGGVVKQGGKFVGNNTHNVDNVKSGVKTLSKVAHPADAEGHAVGAGTGENSVKGATNTTSPLKHIK